MERVADRRPLTPPFSEGEHQAHCLQTQSALFKLPLEIRQQIYTDVLKGDVHLRRRDEESKPSRLGLLRTCRQMYIESIKILYTHSTIILHNNKFNPDKPGGSFAHPLYVDLLRSGKLHLDFRLSCRYHGHVAEGYDLNSWILVPRIWKDTISVIKGVKWMRKFHLSLRDMALHTPNRCCDYNDDITASELEDKIFPLLNEITHLEEFMVEVNFEMEAPINSTFKLLVVTDEDK